MADRLLRILRRIAAGGLFCLVVGGLAFTAILLWRASDQSNPLAAIRDPVRIPPRTRYEQPVALGGRSFGGRIAPATVQLALTRIDRNTQTLFVTATVDLTPTILEHLETDRDAASVRAKSFTPTGAGRREVLILRVIDYYGLGQGTMVPIPLARFFNAEVPGLFRASVSFALPLEGQPQAFPRDWYQLDGVVVLFPGSGYSLVTRSVSRTTRANVTTTTRTVTRSPDIPLNLAVVSGSAMRGESVEVASDRATQAADLNLIVRTSGTTRVFAFIAASIPLLLAALALIAAVLGLRREPGQRQELGFAVALGVVAALPIRALVVPGDLEGLTEVDYVLGLGVVAAVSVLVLALALNLWSVPRELDGGQEP